MGWDITYDRTLKHFNTKNFLEQLKIRYPHLHADKKFRSELSRVLRESNLAYLFKYYTISTLIDIIRLLYMIMLVIIVSVFLALPGVLLFGILKRFDLWWVHGLVAFFGVIGIILCFGMLFLYLDKKLKSWRENVIAKTEKFVRPKWDNLASSFLPNREIYFEFSIHILGQDLTHYQQDVNSSSRRRMKGVYEITFPEIRVTFRDMPPSETNDQNLEENNNKKKEMKQNQSINPENKDLLDPLLDYKGSEVDFPQNIV